MTRIRATVTWDLQKIDDRLDRVLEDLGKELDVEFQYQFKQEVYKWKGPQGVTRRKNGEVVTEPRNIVDTGALRNSQQWTVRRAKSLVFAWGGGFVDYAGAVFFGIPYPGANGPGRDWVAPVLKRFPVVQAFATFWKSYASKT